MLQSLVRRILFASFVVTTSIAPAFAAPSAPAQPDRLLEAARESVVSYALFRMAGLGGGFGNPIERPQICGLMGQARMGFLIYTGLGYSDADIDQDLTRLAGYGFTLARIRASIAQDLQDCSKPAG